MVWIVRLKGNCDQFVLNFVVVFFLFFLCDFLQFNVLVNTYTVIYQTRIRPKLTFCLFVVDDNFGKFGK